ncbi:hypothetical protein I204_02976 [Kwoniella mangroviensis CBS 8886]|nr:hypothetical protein I204_02976 [Kwoniella mangroviensis CBS 8886]
MDRMTDDLWGTIFQSLDPISFLRCSETCRPYNQNITGTGDLQLTLHRHLYQCPTSLRPVTSVRGSALSSHEQLRDLIQIERNMSTFELEKTTVKIGPGEIVCAAYDECIITKLKEPRPARDQEGRWRLVMEYTETKASSGKNA